MTSEEFTELALSFPGVVARPHFDRTAFQIAGKRIFATLHVQGCSVNMPLRPEAQAEFVALHPGVYPVPNKFGLRGWTTFELRQTPEDIVQAALEIAYTAVLKPK